MLYPLSFQPIFKERVWGGRNLESLYAKPLPPGRVIGESWEVSDRPGDVSVVADGPLAGKDLRWLMENRGVELLGREAKPGERFPLLIKLLDAQQALSLQVHPPQSRAAALNAEPKTEMWFIAQAKPEAELYVGLKRGVSRADFEKHLQAGTVAGCFHRISVKEGDTMFLPSGRVHALGAGLVLFEIQQNSDTTYRVFDWNRLGLDGKPRDLHVAESLECINFEDHEPSLVDPVAETRDSARSLALVRDRLFNVDLLDFAEGGSVKYPVGKLRILGVVHGELRARGGGIELRAAAGSFCVLPASLDAEVEIGPATKVLVTELGDA